ncbi:MAG: hypothetical protein M3T56_01485, partial [Chloroflexota bacterium]|nr:hypothetical protein [Chloroflexota bacterium]
LRENEVYRLVGGVRTTIAGGPGARDTLAAGNGDGSRAVAAPLQGPGSVAFGKNGEVFIAESGDGRVRRVDVAGYISTYTGNGTCVGGLGPPNPGAANATSLCGAQFIAGGTNGDLYIARQGSAWIEVVDTSGQLRLFATGPRGDAMHFDQAGDLIVGDDEGRLLRFDSHGRSTVIASGLGLIADFATAGDGSIYVLHWPEPHTAGRVNRITKLSPG